jgi:OTU domain-containing protein 6
MGAKRNKLKKAFSPPQLTATPSAMCSEDDDLMNDLMAELDSRDKTVQSESADVLNQMQMNQQSQQIESVRKREPKSRFQARQVYS